MIIIIISIHITTTIIIIIRIILSLPILLLVIILLNSSKLLKTPYIQVDMGFGLHTGWAIEVMLLPLLFTVTAATYY